MSEDGSVTAAQSWDAPRRQGGDCDLVVLEQRLLTRRPLLPLRTLCVGRAEECDVVLHDPAASRRHALLRVGDEITIEDLDSRNGIRVRGVRLRPGQPTTLQPGDAAQIGGATLLVQGRAGSDARHGSAKVGGAERAGGAALRDPEMRAVYEWIARVAPSDITVLVSGETGAGKELVAEAIHRASGRRSRKRLLRINCAALSQALLESELFGHERGAFTGASVEKRGLIEAADGGTTFLDEIGELPLDAQAKLLRVLETREVLRVGGVNPRRVDVRFIAASNRDLRAEVTRGAFRKDLYFRLHAAGIVVPPLRRRPADLAPLAVHFVEAFCHRMERPVLSLAPAALERLRRHAWPGNVRELRNVVECAVLRATGGTIEAADLPPDLDDAPEPPIPERTPLQPVPAPADNATAVPLNETQRSERERIVRALSACHGNQTRAAELLTMPRRTLVAKLSAYEIPRPRAPRRQSEG
jgi:two-component system, NtrC family, response regulator AtoC